MVPWTKARSDLANAIRYGREDDAARARQQLLSARAEAYIEKLLAATPPLSDEDKAHLSRLLTEPSRVDGAA